MFIATADLRMLHARDVAERTGAGGAAASGLKTDSDIAAGSRALHGRELQQAASSWLTPPPDELDGGLGECGTTKTAGAELGRVAAGREYAAQRGGCGARQRLLPREHCPSAAGAVVSRSPKAGCR